MCTAQSFITLPFSRGLLYSVVEILSGYFVVRSVSSPVCRLPRVGGNNTAVSLLYKSAAVLFPEGKKEVLCVFFRYAVRSPF